MKRSLTVFTITLSCVACSDSGAGSGSTGVQNAETTSATSSEGSNGSTTSGGSTSIASTSDATSSASTSEGGSDASSTMSTTGGDTSGSTGGTTSMGSTSVSSGGAAATTTDSTAGGAASSSTGGGSSVTTPTVLVFSYTTGYRHVAIETGVQALQDLALARGWSLTATEDPTVFSDAGLSSYNVIVFLNTNDEALDDTQQAAMENFIRAGNGYVGIHSASATEYYWAWYGELVGAYFNAHPDVQQATVVVEDTNHPSTAHLSGPWTRTDEWYGFATNPRDAVNVLLTLDEQSYSPGDGAMGTDHPIAWYHEYDGGRSFYTGLGHTFESYAEADFLEHIAGGIEWASGSLQ